MPFSAPFGGTAGCERPGVTAQPWRSFNVLGSLLAISESCVPQIPEKVGPELFQQQESIVSVEFNSKTHLIVSCPFCVCFPICTKTHTHLLMPFWVMKSCV